MAGATDYPIYRNGSLYADPSQASICAAGRCHYTDSAATGQNCTSGGTNAGYCQETVYTYGVYAHNGSGNSAEVFPGNYSYFNGSGPDTGNSCGNFSGGGFGAYTGTSVLAATFVNGSHFVNVTTANGTYNGTVYPDQGFTDGSGAVSNSIATGGVGNPYFYPFGTGSEAVTVNSLSPSNGSATGATLNSAWDGPTGVYTLTLSNAAVASSVTLTNGSTAASWSVAVNGATGSSTVTPAGSGSTGTYYMSAAAVGSASGDWIEAQPSSSVGGGNGAEACPQTQVAESPHTFALAEYSKGPNYMQQYVGAKGSPGYDANWGAYTCWGMDIYVTTTTQSIYAAIHTRPGTHASGTGDIYSTRYPHIVNGLTSPYVAGGTLTQNAWNHLCVTLSDLGIGSGQISAYATSTWHGHGTISGGNTLTIVDTLDGNANNIAVNEYIADSTSSGWGCIKVTSVTTPGTTYGITGCPQGGTGAQTNVEMYDANLYVQSVTSGVGPDNGGIVTGNSEPTATFLGGCQSSQGGTANPTGVCQYDMFTGNSATIVAAGTGSAGVCTSGCVTFGVNRYSVYKPELFFKDTSGFQVTYLDNMGGTMQ